MQCNNSLKTMVVISIVAILLTSSFVSIGVSTKSKTIMEKSSSINRSLLKIEIPSPYIGVKKSALGTLAKNDFNTSENIVVSNATGNESYPSIIINGLNGLVAYQKEENTRIYLRKTSDYGQNWSDEVQLVVYFSETQRDIEAVSPDISFSPNNNKAYGAYVCPKNNYGVNGFFITPDIVGDLTNTVTYTVDWTIFPDFKFWGFKNSNIVTYENSTTPWVMTLIGSTNYTDESGQGACNDSIMFSFYDLVEPKYISIVWFPDIENCRNLSLASEFGSPNIYGVCEKIQDDGYIDILFFKGNPRRWYYESLFENKTFSVPFANLIHPDITVNGNDIYIVAEKEKDGLNEILLFHSNNGGLNWDPQRTIVTNKPPSVDFSMTKDRLDAYFFDNSTDEDGYISSWLWDFGDGNTSIIKNPHHLYGISGDYTVTLTVTDDDNTENTTNMLINVDNTTPIANFTFSPEHPEHFVEFTDTSIQYENYTNDNWTWDFGDGSNFTYIQNPTHTYDYAGIYLITLKVKNETINKTDSIQKIIKVGFIADFTIEPEDPAIDDIIWFNDTSSDIYENIIINWTWDFGDGSGRFDKQNMTHRYLRPDVYQVTLKVRDNLNNVQSTQKNISIRSNQIIPRYSNLYANEDNLYCVYSESKNILLVNSTDNGKSWSKTRQLNSLNGSVFEEYHNSYIPDSDHVFWIDEREGDKDIYSIVKTIPEIDLRIIPESLEITTDYIPLFKTKNRIKFTVENQGTTFVEQIRVIITIEFSDELNKESIVTSYPAYIYHLSGGAKKTFDKPLFRLTATEFIRALIDFAGINNISVTIDPEGKYSDSNIDDNTCRFPEGIDYSTIFPRFYFFEKIVLITT